MACLLYGKCNHYFCSMKSLSRGEHYVYRTFELVLIAVGLSYSRKTSLKMLRAVSGQTFDAIIVPGVPFDGKHWSLVMRARVCWARMLFDSGITRNIIFSGGAVHTPWVEGRIMAMYAEALGLPSEHLIVEDKAEHSTENILYSYKLAQKMGLKRVALASDPFQSKLLSNYARKRVAPDMSVLPVVYHLVDLCMRSWPEPQIDHELARVKDFVPLKERESLSKRLQGTRGGNVDPLVYD
jgi:uncharacterized SAM-binding protein YcdF (DUF218 family)